MAYTIVKSDGTTLTTILDGTLNVTSTSISLPGRNYPSYGLPLVTDLVHMLENFADPVRPAHPITGQLWFNTNEKALYVCSDGDQPDTSWWMLTSTASGGTTTFGNVRVTGDIEANNIRATNLVQGTNGTFVDLTVTGNANIHFANIADAAVSGNLLTRKITTGGPGITGEIIGTWTLTGQGDAFTVAGGNLVVSKIKTDSYCYANGMAFNPSGTYTNSNVYDYLTGSNGISAQSRFSGAIIPSSVTTGELTAKSGQPSSVINGTWTLGTGATLNATYADLAERHHADGVYSVGTVLKVGGENDVTQVSGDDCADVLGVVSSSYAYLMNATAGGNDTHPPVGMIGRVKVRVVGPISKHDRITTAPNGCAKKATADSFGWALETNLDQGEKLVDCVIK